MGMFPIPVGECPRCRYLIMPSKRHLPCGGCGYNPFGPERRSKMSEKLSGRLAKQGVNPYLVGQAEALEQRLEAADLCIEALREASENAVLLYGDDNPVASPELDSAIDRLSAIEAR